jgi:hypothetical protein
MAYATGRKTWMEPWLTKSMVASLGHRIKTSVQETIATIAIAISALGLRKRPMSSRRRIGLLKND